MASSNGASGGTAAAPNKSGSSSSSSHLFGLVWTGVALYGVYFAISWAYKIRLQAIEEYGPVIHEFDPWFNYRATEYLYYNGASAFFKWFDYMAWYPLGRPVGTTIYPGMQFTAVYLKNHVFGESMSLNDVCCYMPAWFGAFSTFLIGCLAYECSVPQNTGLTAFTVLSDIFYGKKTDGTVAPSRKIGFGFRSPALECGVCAMGFMAVVPAHLMRSVGGGYDNESVAISAMSLTFLLWVRSLRSDEKYSFVFGALTGVAYFYMVAAWGGYVFVLNLIGCHAVALVLMGRFSTKIYLSYSLFYSIGTTLAIQVPVVGWAPLKSLEQLAPGAVFLAYQILQYCEVVRKKNKLSRLEAWKLRVRVSLIAAAVGIALLVLMTPKGYFGPISSRVRGLFVKHTKTGNPLVDSVAEHQPASNQAYFQYLHHLCTIAPVGLLMVMFNFGDGPSFLLVYGMAAYFFSHKMVRLILLTGPIAAALGGIAVGRAIAWCVGQVWGDEDDDESEKSAVPTATVSDSATKKKKKIPEKKKKKTSSFEGFAALTDGIKTASKSSEGVIVKRTVAVATLVGIFFVSTQFKDYAWAISKSLSHPTIIAKGTLKNGQVVYVDDYREAYWWLRDNTPEDSRVMAWWDYGYQIAGIANRTTIADGNTWNHEHIALLGKILTGDVNESYEIARHLADYVLVWGGGGGDDLAKSPHLARIANSVYRDHCPGDPTCRAFGMQAQGVPSPMMRNSFLFNLHSHQIKPGVTADPTKFKEEYRSKYGKVRIYKLLNVAEESKRWVADPKNRLCDVPGSWFCPGQYPPAMQSVLAGKTDFAQLEDFNRGVKDDEYQKQYFENLADPKKAREAADAHHQAMKKEEKSSSDSSSSSSSSSDNNEGSTGATTPPRKPTQAEIDAIYNRFEDTEESTLMWKLVSSNAISELEDWLGRDPVMAFVRSSDGRGPMWWAFENRNQDIVRILMKHGVSHQDKDKNGKTPVELLD